MAENTNEGRNFAVEDNDTSAYVGVSPEYQTYASETEKPFTGEGAEADILKTVQESDEANRAGTTRGAVGPGDNERAAETGTSEKSDPATLSPAEGTGTNADPTGTPADSTDGQSAPKAKATKAQDEDTKGDDKAAAKS